MAKRKNGVGHSISPYPIDEAVQRFRALMLGDSDYRTRYQFQLDPITQDQYAFKLSQATNGRYGTTMTRITSGVLASTGNNQTQVTFDAPDANWSWIIIFAVFIPFILFSVVFSTAGGSFSSISVMTPFVLFILGIIYFAFQSQRSKRERIQREIEEVLGLSDEFSAF